MRIVITGSSGFIGRHLVSECERRYPDARIVKVDSADGNDCREFFRENDAYADLAIHCAALTGGIEGTTNNAAITGAVNAQLDGAYFEWALRTKPGRIVYISSSCAYPVYVQQYGRILDESDIDLDHYVGIPERTYGWVKLNGEVLANSIRAAGVPVSIVRPFAVYGADQETCHVVPTFIERALSDDKSFEVWGDGTQTHDFIHVDDAAKAILATAENSIDGPVNIGTGVGTSVDDVAHMAMTAVGRQRPITHNLFKPTGVPYRVADVSLLKSYFTPTITVEQTVFAKSPVPYSYGRGDDLA